VRYSPSWRSRMKRRRSGWGRGGGEVSGRGARPSRREEKRAPPRAPRAAPACVRRAPRRAPRPGPPGAPAPSAPRARTQHHRGAVGDRPKRRRRAPHAQRARDVGQVAQREVVACGAGSPRREARGRAVCGRLAAGRWRRGPGSGSVGWGAAEGCRGAPSARPGPPARPTPPPPIAPPPPLRPPTYPGVQRDQQQHEHDVDDEVGQQVAGAAQVGQRAVLRRRGRGGSQGATAPVALVRARARRVPGPATACCEHTGGGRPCHGSTSAHPRPPRPAAGAAP
jgi:hypothetical protein